MSYCSKCGSYIPDSALTCPACGRPKAWSGSTAQAQAQAQTQARTQTAQTAESARRSESAHRRRERQDHPYQSSCEERNSTSFYEDTVSREERAYEDFSAGDHEDREENLISALGYLGPLVLLPLLTRRDSEYARFHANQSLALMIFSILCSAAGSIVPGVGWIASAFGGCFSVYGVIKGMSNAVKGKMQKLPLIGELKILGKHGGNQ